MIITNLLLYIPIHRNDLNSISCRHGNHCRTYIHSKNMADLALRVKNIETHRNSSVYLLQQSLTQDSDRYHYGIEFLIITTKKSFCKRCKNPLDSITPTRFFMSGEKREKAMCSRLNRWTQVNAIKFISYILHHLFVCSLEIFIFLMLTLDDLDDVIVVSALFRTVVCI